MKIFLTNFLLMVLCATNTIAQKYNVTWGDDTKMKKGTVDMKLVNADKTGAYFLIGDLKSKVFSVTTNYKLKKFDANFDEVYEKDFSKTFKNATISNINPLNNKLYAFADVYDKRQNIYTIDGAEINKDDGSIVGETKEIGNYTLNSDRDDVDYVLKPTPDSSEWILITAIAAKDKSSNTVYITLLNEKLNKKATATIHLKQSPDLLSFADIAFTNTGKILLLGKEYEYLNGSTKKRNRVFKDFTLIRYNVKGDEEAVYKLDANNDKYSIGGKLVTLPDGEVVFAGFYSNVARGRKQQLNGIYTARIDAGSNTLTQNSALEISTDMLTDVSDSTANDEDDDNKKDKRSKKSDDDAEGFSNTFLIRNVIINPLDRSIIMVAESYKFSTQYYYFAGTGASPGTSQEEYIFTNKDLMLINLSADGQLKKISVIPKKQKESYTQYGGYGYGAFSYDGGIFAQGGTYPYYSSIASLVNNNKLILFFNDDNRNANIKSGTDPKKVKWTQNFNRSSLYALSIDLTTGNATKNDISDNSDDDIAMPRFAFVADNKTVYLPASKKKMIGKTELKIGKIVIKN